MNLKLRLERLGDTKSWARLHFTDGTSVTGRVERIGHDYIEIESYGDFDHPGRRDYAKHLVPIQVIKYITVESASFADAERQRLNYLAQSEVPADSLPEYEK